LLTVLDTYAFVDADQRSERVAVGGRTYDVALRYKRHYLDYWVELRDAKQEVYEGTSMAKGYSSDLRLHSEDGATLLDAKTWMNNPLRYAGVTMYQSEFGVLPSGAEFTHLQVVTNAGWMIPYVSCMIVAVGMFFQFGGTLLRFVRGRPFQARTVVWHMFWSHAMGHPLGSVAVSAAEAKLKKRAQREAIVEPRAWQNKLGRWLPLAAVALAGIWVAQSAVPKSVKSTEMDLDAFGRLPVMDQGRAKPFDTLARTTLRVVAKRQTFKDHNEKAQPAIRWLLDLMSHRMPQNADDRAEKGQKQHSAADNDRVYYIESLEVQQLLGLKPRSGYMYALSEFDDNLDKLEAESRRIFAQQSAEEKAQAAAGNPVRKASSVYERQVLELVGNLTKVRSVEIAFAHDDFASKRSELADLKSPAKIQSDPGLQNLLVQIVEFVRMKRAGYKELMEAQVKPPQAVEVVDNHGHKVWETFAKARTEQFLYDTLPTDLAEKIADIQPSAAARALDAIFAAYRASDAEGFNLAVADYRDLLSRDAPEAFTAAHLDFEAFFNRFEPFYLCAVLYMFAFVLAAAALLGLEEPLNRTAFALIAATFLLHNFALASRMFISGRPPITNLYTTAVFIGWACVLFSLIFEAIYRLGFGNLVAGWTGFCTLLIAHFLSVDKGDTFTVLEAVLDTQFWLSTHVVTINLGYASTFLAGFFGLQYVLLGVCTPALSKEKAKTLARMTYGTLCFAMFFSFVGTVLGGLWADDSWGRFWGWDNKENGALMIVLWNALVLHARWGGIVKDRGLALLCVGGNIVTAWSYFGTNELGVGLHAYGRIEGVATTLLFFWATQLGIIALGCIPKDKWWSFRRRQQPIDAELVG
jgi:ABC-type transport system involved in cytochrome c biogenesis permease subunit